MTMKGDPTIDEIRETRHCISEAVNHDPQKLVQYYRKLQERHQDRLISRGVNAFQVEKETDPNPYEPPSCQGKNGSCSQI